MKNDFKILFFYIILLSLTVLGNAQYNIKYKSEVPRTDSIRGDLNGDNIPDLLVVHYEDYVKTKMNVNIYFQDNIGIYKLIADKFFYQEGAERPPIFSINEGNIVFEFAYRNSVEQDIYKYYPDVREWYLYFLITVWSDEEECGINGKTPFYKGPNSFILGDTLNEYVSITTIFEQKKVWDKLINTYQTLFNEYKTKAYDKLTKIDKKEIIEYLTIIGISDSSVQKLNDIAFFLIEYAQSLKSNNKEHYIKARTAIELLENIVCHYGERSVAYLNLGDAYWLLNDTAFAKKAYQKYINQMKASDKEAKIPKRVWERGK